MAPTRRQRTDTRRAQANGMGGRLALAGALVIVLAFACTQGASGCAAAAHSSAAIPEPASEDGPAPNASTPDSRPERDADAPQPGDWNLVLVNPWNPLPDGYEPVIVHVEQGFFIDERCAADAADMMAACRSAGLDPFICSAYRSQETQEALFDANVQRGLASGLSLEDAKAEAGTSVAVPGTSEHQLGLALDIVDFGNQNLDESQEQTPVQQWLIEHSWEYGFVLRYPSDKSDTTGIIYEPWHYRYVGKDAAREMRDWQVCLEDYRAMIGG